MESSAAREFDQAYEIAKADVTVLDSDDDQAAALLGAIRAKDLGMVSVLMNAFGGNPDD